MNRLLVLHLRTRRAVPAATGLVVVALAASWAGDWLTDRFGGPSAHVPVVALAPLLAAVLLAPGLAGRDEELERSTALPWRRCRAAHATAALLLVAVLLTLAGQGEAGTYGAHALLRGTAGCLGLVLLATPVLGARLAWAPVSLYVATAYLATPREPGALAALWGWPVLPSTTALTHVVPLAALVLGVLAYALRGSSTGGD